MDEERHTTAPEEFPAGLRFDLRLCAESAPRLLKVVVRGGGPDPEDPRDNLAPRPRPREVVPILGAAIEAGLFAGPREGQRLEVVRTDAYEPDPRSARAGRVETWEWLLPPVSLDALSAFARMIWATGAHSLTLAQNAPEERLTLRSLGDFPRTTHRSPGFEVTGRLGEDEKDAVILVAFRDEVPPEIVRATQATLRAWGALVAFGAFTAGAGFPRSAALFSEVGTELRREVFAKFDALAVGRDGWAALWTGLGRIHARDRIATVEMR